MKAELTPAEDRAWTHAFNYHLEEGLTEDQADKLAWRDVCLEFPRLKDYEGALP